MVTYAISIDYKPCTKAAVVLNRKVLMLCSIVFHIYFFQYFLIEPHVSVLTASDISDLPRDKGLQQSASVKYRKTF